MGGACGTYWGRREMYVQFWSKNWEVKRSLARPGRDWRIIVKWAFKKWDGVDSIHAVNGTETWRVL